MSDLAQDVEPKPLKDKLSVSSMTAKAGEANEAHSTDVIIFFMLFLRAYNVENVGIFRN
ncbi:conserved hypothetical protein [Vibrio crassostreae]|nr:conserved hypothetical protein [Vibrio crassostreae]CAK2129802.1 conserved hypothetical protein [Vibrio crassostreae]CAK2134411.1 conserved hypothetical protein [Vibrio crassostreae]CAK2172449.1 conserved hypothetical protein [Vibrio crassostreae]CAK2257643.1 conserved hypothetical protein [Vibrio crassostreae]